MAMAKTFFLKSFLTWYRKLIRHSKYRWVVLLGTLLYVANPIDLVPSFIPIVGWMDDGLVVTLALSEVTQLLLERRRHLRQQAEADPTPETEPLDPYAAAIDVDAVVMG
jgi:uncharacterized membrane protein YkvA (DUF1232 family)